MSGPWQGNPQDNPAYQGNPGPQHSGGYQQGGYQQGGYQQGGYQPDGWQGGYDQGGYQQGNYQQGGSYQQGGWPQGGQQDGYDHGGYQAGGFDQSSFVQNQVNQNRPQDGQFQPGYQQGYPQPGGNFNPYGPRPPKTGLIIGIVVGVLVLIGAGVGSYFLFFKKDSPPTNTATPGGNTVVVPGGQNGVPQANPPGGNQGSDGTAQAFVQQMVVAIQNNDYVALNNATCAADRGDAAQVQALQEQVRTAGVTVTVVVNDFQESGNQASVSYTLTAVNPTTGETKTDQQSATFYRNTAGAWITCDQPLGPND